MQFRSVVLAVAILSACTSPFAPEVERVVQSSTRIPTSPKLRRLWAEMETCSGAHGNVNTITFAVAPSAGAAEIGFPISPTEYAVGLFIPSSRTIIVATYYQDVEWTWRHEMLHALFPFVGGHPPEIFNGACGDFR